MSQMFQTEICECGKLRQARKLCKACGAKSDASAEEFYRPQRFAVAKSLPVVGEDEMEFLRR
jgi:hypothetical protein